MQVFKLYFKLLKSVSIPLFIYIGIFSIFIYMLSVNNSKNSFQFQQEKIETAIINYDEDSLLVQGLFDYLEEYCNFVDVGDSDKELDDALFFRRVEYILTIPYEFGGDFITGKDVVVDKKTVPDAVYATTVDQAINNYFNTARIYINSVPNITEEELVSSIKNDLNVVSHVEIDSIKKDTNQFDFMNYYFNTSAYIILACCLLGISMVMLSFHNKYIRRRNVVAPISIKNLNIQLIEGNFIFVLCFDIFLILISYLLIPDKYLNGNVILYWINVIVYSISALSISYLVAMLVKSKKANSAISYVLPLGLSFISGAFVPQSLLGDTVLKLGSFTPMYWFVKGNNTIAALTSYNLNNMKPIVLYMAIQVGFAITLFSVSLVVSKNRRQSEN